MDYTGGRQEPLTDPSRPAADSATATVLQAGAVVLLLIIFLWITMGWKLALILFIFCLLPIGYYFGTSHWSSPFRIYSMMREARNQVIREPRLYTQDDMVKLDAGQSPIRDWTLASGSYRQQSQDDTVHVKETQFVFSSSVSRPMGSFWTKPKSLMWTISGYGTDFTITEGLVSETGKCYWVEQHDFDERGKILKLVQGHWDYDSNGFVGQYIDSKGTGGSYPTLLRQTIKVVDTAGQAAATNDMNNYVNFGHSNSKMLSVIQSTELQSLSHFSS
eukprot:scaffold19016_cov147-Cylindrotheca_fusiformis.AAC.4